MKLCVALDLPSARENLALVRALRSENIWLKVGLRSFIRDGKPLLEEIRAIAPHVKIFLDLKIHDIPNTMADAASSMAQLGVDMFNVHASSGKEAMSAVMDRLGDMAHPPLVLAVSALTSFDAESFAKIYNEPIEKKVISFAKDAYESGLSGMVCSVYESAIIKHETTTNFLTLAPGIRPFGEASDDQKRVATIEVAKNELCDFIVVGRPIYQSSDPLGVTQKILGACQTHA